MLQAPPTVPEPPPPPLPAPPSRCAIGGGAACGCAADRAAADRTAASPGPACCAAGTEQAAHVAAVPQTRYQTSCGAVCRQCNSQSTAPVRDGVAAALRLNRVLRSRQQHCGGPAPICRPAALTPEPRNVPQAAGLHSSRRSCCSAGRPSTRCLSTAANRRRQPHAIPAHQQTIGRHW